MQTFTLATLAFALFFCSFLRSADAHSYLTVPKPISDFRGGCRMGGFPGFGIFNCPGPCVRNYGNIDENTITATVRRGDTMPLGWAKNNHDGGFTRLTIVRRADMHNRQAHDRAIFAYKCWDAQRRSCQAGTHECGTDEDRITFRSSVKVPTVYPDGVYVLGYAWFGEGNFGEYYSCALIRIQGGPLTNTYPVHAERCNSKYFALRTCVREPCGMGGVQTRRDWPKSFQNGNKLPDLRTENFGGRRNGGNNPPPPMNTPAPPPPMNNNPPPPMNNNNGKPRCASSIRTNYGERWTGGSRSGVSITFNNFQHNFGDRAKLLITFSRKINGVWDNQKGWGPIEYMLPKSDRTFEVNLRNPESYFGFNLEYPTGALPNVQKIEVIYGKHRNGQECQRQTI